MKAHRWEKKLYTGTELYGKTLGVIGIGRIGMEVARRALVFGMKVIAYDVIEIKTELEVDMCSQDDVLSQADILTFHLPLTGETRHMISDKEFNRMKDGVIIINASRGGIIDEKALLKALESGKVNFALIDHPRVIATPHIGAAAKEGQQRAGLEVVKILEERYG